MMNNCHYFHIFLSLLGFQLPDLLSSSSLHFSSSHPQSSLQNMITRLVVVDSSSNRSRTIKRTFCVVDCMYGKLCSIVCVLFTMTVADVGTLLTHCC
ncbi:hypothetical protein Hdeb2414_s0843g00952991 [Helianthus debilis subsp. tardiflorus]